MPILDGDTAWQHCDESRRMADKLLIRPYEVDQAGTGERAGRQIPTKASTCTEPVHLRVMPAAHRQHAFSQCIYSSQLPGGDRGEQADSWLDRAHFLEPAADHRAGDNPAA